MEEPKTLERDWEHVGFPEQIGELLSRTLKNMPLYLKGAETAIRFDAAGRENGVFLFHYPGNVNFTSRIITLYATLNRQLEIDFEIREAAGFNSLRLSPLRARIGKRTRGFPRYRSGGEFVQAANFQLHRPGEKNLSGPAPLAHRILFREFEKSRAGDFPGLRVFDFHDRERPFETRFLEKGGMEKAGGIFVRDTLKAECFASPGPGFLDYGMVLAFEGKMAEAMARYREERIRSFVTMAIPRPEDPRGKPAGFIHYGRRDEVMEPETCDRIRGMTAELSRSLGDVSTVQVPEKQGIVNISEGGVALKITRPEILECLASRKNVNFDLLFRMQAPMRFQGRIAHMKRVDDHVVLGIGFEGTTMSETRTDNKERLRALLRMGVEQSMLEAC